MAATLFLIAKGGTQDKGNDGFSERVVCRQKGDGVVFQTKERSWILGNSLKNSESERIVNHMGI